jgi:ribosomal protein S18 acetylase RimI-like enzyme
VRWQIRPFAPAADREWAAALWAAAMPSSWPVLPAAIAMLGEGLVAEAGTGPVGLAAVDAVDSAGSVPLILVHPAWQGHGIGTSLLAAALDTLRARGVSEVTAGSGGSCYIWPGVPRDLPAAVAFFAARDWRYSHDTLDLVADLAGYQPPPALSERAASTGISLTLASGSDLAEVVAFEAANFPQWVRSFSAGKEGILIARERAGNIAGALLLDGPGADTVLTPMLGPAAGTIGCVGIAPPLHDRGIGTALVTRASQILAEAGTRACHIGWTTRETFYRRAGYQPWRRYAMFRSPA